MEGVRSTFDPELREANMSSRVWYFVCSDDGDWEIGSKTSIRGDDPLPSTAKYVTIQSAAIVPKNSDPSISAAWVLRGVTSNERYVTKEEKAGLVAKQAGIGRESCRHAAVILIRKSPAW